MKLSQVGRCGGVGGVVVRYVSYGVQKPIGN